MMICVALCQYCVVLGAAADGMRGDISVDARKNWYWRSANDDDEMARLLLELKAEEGKIIL